MATARRQRGPKVDLPTVPSTPFRLGRIGVIAAVGFGIGIAWPRLAGVRLVPELPVAPASSQDLSGAPDESPAASAAKATPKPPTEPAPEATPAQPPVVGEAQVTSCRDAGGGRVEHCGAVDFDRASSTPWSTCENQGPWVEFTANPMHPVRRLTRLLAATEGE
jgi:hypothetical protein